MQDVYPKNDFVTKLFKHRMEKSFSDGDRHFTEPAWFLSFILFVLIAFCDNLTALASERRSMAAFADSITVRGVVSDNAGTLPGVSVSLKSNRSVSTMTDARGNFNIKVPAEGTLVFSSIGYATQEVAVNRRSEISLTLSEEVKSLNEVVVVGYGTQSREKLIGSVAQVSGEQIAERPVSQLKHALTGQLPGVIITQRSGQPGVGSGRISVRGVGSFGATQDALILVDGIIVNNFNDIDPNDVESISVLKDASTAAIYGSRAANGVILVTTKSGQTGDPKFTYNSYIAKQKPTVFPDYINSWEYQQLLFEAMNGSSQLTPEQIAEVEKYRAQNDVDYPNNNFLDKVLSKDGFQVSNSLSVSGGTDKTKYNFSFGHLFQDGMVEENDYTRYNLRLNLNTKLSEKFNFTTRLAAISSKVNEPMGAIGGTAGDMLGVIGQAARFSNTLVDIYPNGDYGLGIANGGTAVSDLDSKSFMTDRSLNLNANFRLDYKPIQDLTLSFVPGYRRNIGRVTSFRASMRLNDNITLGPNSLRENYSENEYYILQGLAEYKKYFGKHDINIVGGYSFEDYKGQSLMAFRDNLPSNDLTVLDISSPQNQQSGGNGNEYALESQFLRVGYNYASKYLLQGTVRRDGSSRFPASQKYAIFPSVGAAWRIAEEPFIKDNLSWLNELKIKASWGILGNQEIGEYPYQNTLVSNSNTTYVFGNQITPGAARTRLVDSTLHWESTRTADIGLEVAMLQNKINFSATYFNRITDEILVSPNASVSNVLGFNLSQQNSGKLLNRGLELTAGYNNKFGEFGFNFSGNLTILKNEVLDLGVGNITQPNGLIGNGTNFIGYPSVGNGYDSYYGYMADGMFIDAQDVVDYEKTADQQAINANPAPGDIRYKDISGPDGVPDGKVEPNYDRVVLGSQIPKYSYGASIGGSYKGFDLSALIQGVAGVQGRLNGYAGWALYNNYGNIQRWQYEGRWTEENPERYAAYPRIEQIPGSGSPPNTILSSFWILNGAYTRVRNVQLGYNIPQKTFKSVGISNARVYFTVENPLTISNYYQGWDPEMVGNQNFYPLMTNYTFGLNVNF